MLRFWMLYAEGGGAPTVRHDSEEGAQREAVRLARQLQKRVYLLEAKAYCEVVDVQWQELYDLPF